MKLIIILVLSAFYISGKAQEEMYTDSVADRDVDIIRDDVETNLNLSPWELYVLTDLTFKLTSKQCPNIDQGVLSSYKEFLTENFRQVPRADVQHEEFLPVYINLIRCMEYVLKKDGIIETDDNNTDQQETETTDQGAISSEAASLETDWTVGDAPEQPEENNEEPVEPATVRPTLKVENGGISSSVMQWIGKMFSWSTETKTNDDEVSAKELNNQENQAWRQYRMERLLYRKARQDFASFFHGMSNVIRKTCPTFHRPNKVFLRQAFLDMTTWATLDQHDTMIAYTQHLHRDQLLKLISECYKTL